MAYSMNYYNLPRGVKSEDEGIDKGTLCSHRSPPPGTSGCGQQNRLQEIKYSKSPDNSGWLRVQLHVSQTVNGESTSAGFLCDYTEVTIIGNDDNGNTHFMIEEGPFRHKYARMSIANASRYLITGGRRDDEGAKLVATAGKREKVKSPVRNDELNQLWTSLAFDGKIAKITLDSDVNFDDKNKQIIHSSPLPKGTYKILTPETTHTSSRRYATDANGDKNLRNVTVWFPIEYQDNSRFVHVGHLSEGCVTIYQLDMWNTLYEYLISHRIKDSGGKYVGTIEIK